MLYRWMHTFDPSPITHRGCCGGFGSGTAAGGFGSGAAAGSTGGGTGGVGIAGGCHVGNRE